MRVNQLIYRFCESKPKAAPSYLAVIVLVVHVVAGDTGMAGIPFDGDLGARRRGHPWERISANVRDHTVELSAFWHVIRHVIPTKSARLSYLRFWLPFSLPRSFLLWLSTSAKLRQRESPAESASPTTVGTKSLPETPTCTKRVGRHPDSFRILQPSALLNFREKFSLSFFLCLNCCIYSGI